MRRVVLWAGLVAASTVVSYAQPNPSANDRSDTRLQRLKTFLKSLGSPLERLAPDFLAAADKHHLDWRLLPSISAVESGCGKDSAKNNIFGWYSARQGFRSIREGIYHVAGRLSASRLYRNKDLDGVLRTYNPKPGYGARVKSFMSVIDPTEPPRARQPLEMAATPASSRRNTSLPEPAE